MQCNVSDNLFRSYPYIHILDSMHLPFPLLFLLTPKEPDHLARKGLAERANELVIPVARGGRSEKCCTEGQLLVCQDIEINPQLLIRNGDINILGIHFTFSNDIEPHGLVYKTEAGDEAVITYSEVTGNMFGSIKTREGRSYAIEKCEGGHVVKEYDVASFPGDIGQQVKEE